METISLASVRVFLFGWFLSFVFCCGFIFVCFGLVFVCLLFFFFSALHGVSVHHCCPCLLEWSVTEFSLKKKKCASLSLWIRSFLCVSNEPFPCYSIEPQMWPPVTITRENSVLPLLLFLLLLWSFPVLRVHLRLSFFFFYIKK